MNYTEVLESIKKTTNDKDLIRVYELIAKDSNESQVAHSVTDGTPVQALAHSVETINQIRDSLYASVQGNREPGTFIAVEDWVSLMVKQTSKLLTSGQKFTRDNNGKIIADSFYNSMTGVGTSSDPGFYNTASIPVAISPQQATAYYASGGLPKVIIEKKVEGPFINGYSYKGNFTKKQLDQFKEHYDKLGVLKAFKNSIRDSLLYGGSAIVPHFKWDNNKLNYSKTVDQMGNLGKKEIDRFWTADRWNLVLVPDTNIEARDYFYPNYFYCPIAGVEIRTERMALVRLNELPFWGAMVQAGWGVSELEGWMKPVLSYSIMMDAVPVMGQQISVVYNHIPADPIIFQNGPEEFEAWSKLQNQKMALWNVTNPQTFNSYGELKTLERQYQGYNELVMLLRDDIGAKSKLPESTIFHTQSKGFSDNTEDVTLKQSEAFKQISNIFCEQVRPLIYLMGLDYFGKGMEDKIRTLELSLDSNTILTNDQKATLGNNFFSMIQIGAGAGMPVDVAAKIARKFISGVEIDDDVIKLFQEAQEKIDKDQKEEQKAQKSQGMFGGFGKKPTQTGNGTPPKSSVSANSSNNKKQSERISSGKGKK
jgi:hypothetical protein